MSNLGIIALGLFGVVFIAWAYMMFRTMFLIRKRAAERTGKMFPGPLTALAEYKIFFTSAHDKNEKNLLLVTTLGLFMTTALAMTVNSYL